MSQCDSVIMSNSSFSWWGLFWEKKEKIICPDKWYGPRGPKDSEDIYEDSWLKVRFRLAIKFD